MLMPEHSVLHCHEGGFPAGPLPARTSCLRGEMNLAGLQIDLMFKNITKVRTGGHLTLPEVFRFFLTLFLVFPETYPQRMKLTVQQINRLLEAVSQKSGYPLEYSSFDDIADAIGMGMTKKYLYENLYLKARDGDKNIMVGVQDNRMNIIARYLGYQSIHQYLHGFREHPVLTGLLGNYYCYVRRNSRNTAVFRSPVRISRDGEEYIFELQGPRWLYKGEVKLSEGCIFILMEAESGKQLHHVYRIGVREKPQVLQGIFSGVSTTFEPIGGRVVLVAVSDHFEKLEGKELTPAELEQGGTLGVRLVRYFDSYDGNNLRINPVMSFGEDDL